MDVERTAHGIDAALDHVHTDTAAGQVGDRFSGGKARFKNQPVDLVFRQAGAFGNQAALDGLAQDAVGIKALAIIGYFDNDRPRFVIRM